MEPPTPIPQSPIPGARHRLPCLYSRTMILCLCVTAFGTPSALLGASTSSPIPLFADTPSEIPPAIAQALPEPPMLKRWVRRQRAMRLNRTALDVMSRPRTGAPTEVTLNLFDNGPRTLDLDQPREHPKQTKVWRGRLRGEAGSDVTLVTHGTAMVGTILSNQRLYKIETAGGNLHRLIEIDEAALPPDHHPIIVANDDPFTASPTEGPSQQTDIAAAAGDTLVDLLVVYTSTAKTQEGGQAATEALIALAVDSANQAYSNSQIAMQLRLVHTAEVAYSESGAIDTDLTRLRSATDGIMDQVHQLRDQYKADLVALIVDNGGGSCGIAYVMTNGPRASFASSAFSVTARDCIVNDTLAHEMGHNMGNAHDRATGGTGAFAYSYGYRDAVGRFRTIMAYACPTVSCPRVKYFSNPNIMINGRPAGIDHAIDPTHSADNARSMNEVRQIVAAWRIGTQDMTPPAAPRNLRVITP
jgi:hypothetical protein